LSIPPLAVGVLWLAVILAITAGFVWLARRLRRGGGGSAEPSASEMLAGFREAHAAGELSDAEYQTIRERLAPAIRLEATGAAGGATTMAEASAALRGVAETLSSGWSVETERAGGDNRPDQRDAAGAGDASGDDGCDAAPPDGGDSTGEGR